MDPAILYMMFYLVPLSGIGTIYLYTQFFQPRIKTRRGNILITRILASGHLKNQWVKPEQESTIVDEPNLDEKGEQIFHRGRAVMKKRSETGYFIKIGKKEKLPYMDAPDFIYFNGPVKRAFFDAEGNQLSVNKMARLVSPIGPKMIDAFGQRMWNVGRMQAFAQRKNMDLILFMALGAAAAAALIGYYNWISVNEIVPIVHNIQKILQSGGVTPV